MSITPTRNRHAAGLASALRVTMRTALNQLHERLGITTVYAIHDQVEAMTLGDRVCVLRDGKLPQVDTRSGCSTPR